METLKQNEVLESLYQDKKIIQNTQLYRFTSDSILLSRFARAKYADVVGDFCAGSGVVGYHFLCLNPQIKSVTAFELQPELADMATRTAQLNGFDNCNVVCTPLQQIGAEYNGKFSLILCNPPYEKGGLENESYQKAICRKEITITLPEIIAAAAKKLKFGGRFALVHRADRLAELMHLLCQANLQPKRMQFVTGTQGAKPYLVMVESVLGGKTGLDILPTIVNK